MTNREWSLVWRVAAILLIAALFPVGAVVYRLFTGPDLPSDATGTTTPLLYTLVPNLTNLALVGTPRPTPVVLVVPNGWTNYTVEDQNFSIAVPTTWQRLPVNAQELDAALEAVRQSNSELADSLGASAQQLIRSGVKLWAYDPDPNSLSGKFATNLTVTRQALPNEVSFDAYVLVNVNQIERLTSRQGELSHQRINLSGVSAEKIRYNLLIQTPDGAGITSAITLYLLLNRDNSYVLTYATRLEQLEHYATTFDQSAATFRFLAP
jgi:hypothetical protein